MTTKAVIRTRFPKKLHSEHDLHLQSFRFFGLFAVRLPSLFEYVSSVSVAKHIVVY